MKYINETIRRRDRLLDEERAIQLLQTAEYGILSMIDEDGMPYAIPVNHVWNGRDSIYIHCAPEANSPPSMRAFFSLVRRTPRSPRRNA